MSRSKKYETPGNFEREIKKYFKSITRTVEITELVPTGKKDKHGHDIYDSKTVYNDMGKPVERLEYVIAPSLEALCRYLGICRDTWGEYATREGYSRIAATAKGCCEAWLVEQLISRPKGVEGIKFALQHGYGWREKQTVEVISGVEEFLKQLPGGDEF